MTLKHGVGLACTALLFSSASLSVAAPPQATMGSVQVPNDRPTWHARRLPEALPGKPPRGPRLVVLEPTVGSLLVGQWILSTHKWELFWRVQNQGSDATRRPATLRIRCEVANVNVPNPLGSDLAGSVCSQGEGSFPIEPLAAGATSSRRHRTLISPMPNATCTGMHARLTARVESGPPDPPILGGETLVLDFCR